MTSQKGNTYFWNRLSFASKPWGPMLWLYRVSQRLHGISCWPNWWKSWRSKNQLPLDLPLWPWCKESEAVSTRMCETSRERQPTSQQLCRLERGDWKGEDIITCRKHSGLQSLDTHWFRKKENIYCLPSKPLWTYSVWNLHSVEPCGPGSLPGLQLSTT